MGLFSKKPVKTEPLPAIQPKEATITVMDAESVVTEAPKPVTQPQTRVAAPEIEEYDESLPDEDEVEELNQLDSEDEPIEESNEEQVSGDKVELTEEMVSNALTNLHRRITELEAMFFRLKTLL